MAFSAIVILGQFLFWMLANGRRRFNLVAIVLVGWYVSKRLGLLNQLYAKMVVNTLNFGDLVQKALTV